MRHASFCTPLIGTIAGGFLGAEGFDGVYQVRPLDRNPFEMLMTEEVDLMQSAVSSSWARIEGRVTFSARSGAPFPPSPSAVSPRGPSTSKKRAERPSCGPSGCLAWLEQAGSREIAHRLASFFPETETDDLGASIHAYQQLETWARDPRIPVGEYEQALDIFEWNKLIHKRHEYESVVRDPWGSFAEDIP